MLFVIIILLTIIQPSYQVIYSCNSRVVCGCSTNPASITRIVGGETAGTATWGWAISISIAGTDLCGGSIISSSWVITAAHCVNGYSPSQITIYAGSTLPQFGSQSRVVSQIIVHPYFRRATYENDIALLRLASPLIMSDPNVSPICIPSVSSATLSASEWPTPGTTVVAVGWGRLSEDGQSATTLQQVTVSAVDYRSSTCSSLVSDAYIQFCAGVSGGGKDTCQGDSGGPLMMFTSSKQWVLVGLTSNGYGCARPTYSGVYTRVAAYETWIKVNTGGSYSPLSLSHAYTMQIPVHSLVLLVVLNFSVKLFSE